MQELIVSCLGCIAAIALGYLMKRFGVLSAEDRKPLNRIITHVTLPCAVLCGAGNLVLDWQVGILVFVGFSGAMLMLLATNLLTRRLPPPERSFYLISCGAFNVGCFTIPFIQSFIAPQYLVFAFAFDAGNALMATNGTYITACSLTGQNRDDGSFFRRLLSSLPFDTYIVILALSMLHISIPKPVIELLSIGAKANPFLAMFVIGVMLEFHFDKASLIKTSRIVAIRLCFGAAMCAAVCLLPLDEHVKKLLCVCLFAPISSMAPIFIDAMGGDTSLSSFAFSCSTIASILLMMYILI